MKGARVVGCGDGAIAIAMVAIGSKAAADVRTGHIANHTTGDESYRSSEEAPEAAPRAMSFTRSPASAAAGRKIAVAMIAMAKRFFMIEPPHCGRGRTKSKFPSAAPTPQRGGCQRVPVNQKLFSLPVAARITRQIEPQLDCISGRWRDGQTRGWNVEKLKDDQRRALKTLAHQDGCAEAALLAAGFTRSAGGLIIEGCAVMRRRRVEISGRERTVVWMRITEEGPAGDRGIIALPVAILPDDRTRHGKRRP